MKESLSTNESEQSRKDRFINIAFQKLLKVWKSSDPIEMKQKLIFSDEILGEIERTGIPLNEFISWKDEIFYPDEKRRLNAFVDQVIVKADDLLKERLN